MKNNKKKNNCNEGICFCKYNQPLSFLAIIEMGSYLCNCLTWLPACYLNLSGPGSQSVSIFIDPGEAHSLDTLWNSVGAEALGSSKLLFPIVSSFIAVRLEGLLWDLLFNLVRAWKWRKTSFWQTNCCLLQLLVSFIHLSKEEPDGEMRGMSLKAWQYALRHDFLNTTDRKTLISQRLFETPRLQFKILLFAFLTSSLFHTLVCSRVGCCPTLFYFMFWVSPSFFVSRLTTYYNTQDPFTFISLLLVYFSFFSSF